LLLYRGHDSVVTVKAGAQEAFQFLLFLADGVAEGNQGRCLRVRHHMDLGAMEVIFSVLWFDQVECQGVDHKRRTFSLNQAPVSQVG